MTNERALELLMFERECVKRADTCDRDCMNCELVQDADEIVQMYTFVINKMATEIYPRQIRF